MTQAHEGWSWSVLRNLSLWVLLISTLPSGGSGVWAMWTSPGLDPENPSEAS